MPSPVYQNMANLIVRLFIRRYPSEIMKLRMWDHRTFGNEIFGRGKLYYYNSIIINNLVQNFIPECWFEKVFPTDFGIEIS
jgi:hypothetical protein